MSLQTTGKIEWITSKGIVEIEVYAREIPVTKEVMRTILRGDLNGNVLQYDTVNDVITTNIDLENYAVVRNNRLRFEKGVVAVSKSELIINLNDEILLSAEATIIGKIVGQSIYTLNKAKDQEFPCVIKEARVPLVYYNDLSDVKVSKVTEEPKRATKKQRVKSKVSLVYDEEDNGDTVGDFKMVSSYELKAAKEDRPAQEVKTVPQEVPDKVETTAKPQADEPQVKKPTEAKEPPKVDSEDKTTAQDQYITDVPQVPVQTASSPQESHVAKDAPLSADNRPSAPQTDNVQTPISDHKSDPQPAKAKYQDIPMSILRSHKYIVKK